MIYEDGQLHRVLTALTYLLRKCNGSKSAHANILATLELLQGAPL